MKAFYYFVFNLAFSCSLVGLVQAEQFGLFFYQITGGTVMITDYPDDATGIVAIPASIDGRSVTAIDSGAFSEVVGITSVVIPSSVATIGNDAFALCTSLVSVTFTSPGNVSSIGPAAFVGCSALTSLNIPSGVTRIEDNLFSDCSSLTSVTIPSGVLSIGPSAFASCTQLGNVNFPASLTAIESSAFENCDGLIAVGLPVNLTSIGQFAFFDCDALTSVSIATRVTSVGNSAFVGCGLLTAVHFAGNAPAMGDTVFDNQTNNPDLRIYFFQGKQGFNAPVWTPVINQPPFQTIQVEFTDPLAEWLISNNLPVDSDLGSDQDGDGVSLLMAYALNLNPNLNLATSIPRPVLSATQMSLSFHGARPGINYSVEYSATLVNWTTEGVLLTDPDVNDMRTATVSRTGPRCFLRLKVSQ